MLEPEAEQSGHVQQTAISGRVPNTTSCPVTFIGHKKLKSFLLRSVDHFLSSTAPHITVLTLWWAQQVREGSLQSCSVRITEKGEGSSLIGFSGPQGDANYVKRFCKGSSSFCYLGPPPPENYCDEERTLLGQWPRGKHCFYCLFFRDLRGRLGWEKIFEGIKNTVSELIYTNWGLIPPSWKICFNSSERDLLWFHLGCVLDFNLPALLHTNYDSGHVLLLLAPLAIFLKPLLLSQLWGTIFCHQSAGRPIASACNWLVHLWMGHQKSYDSFIGSPSNSLAKTGWVRYGQNKAHVGLFWNFCFTSDAHKAEEKQPKEILERAVRHVSHIFILFLK